MTSINSSKLWTTAENENIAWIFPAPEGITPDMSMILCPGMVGENGPIANFVIVNDGWDGPGQGSAALTYFFVSATADVSVADQQAAIIAAFAKWSENIDVSYSPAAGPGLDFSVDIEFGTIAHGGCPYPFPASGGPLAHNFYPSGSLLGGDMHFNDTYGFNIGLNWDIFSIAMHEAGHGLGIGHSALSAAVMYPFIMGVYTDLHADDIAAAQSIYATATSPGVSWNTSPPSSTTSGDTVNFSWDVENGATTGTQVYYDTNNPPTSAGATSVQSGAGGTYSDSITAPVVGGPTTYYFQARGTIDGTLYTSAVSSVVVNAADGSPTGLTVADLGSPTPTFSARHHDLEGDAGNRRRIQIASSSADLSSETSLLWDESSAGVAFAPNLADGAQSTAVTYGGSQLSWNQTYYWRIKYWDVNGNASPWSAEGSFTMQSPSGTMTNASGWQMVGVPTGATVNTSDLTGVGGTFYGWNEVTGAYESVTTLVGGRGYYVTGTGGAISLNSGTAVDGPFPITGLSATAGNTYSGWSMISNPYNGTINWDTIYDGGFTTNIEPFYTKWNGTQYVTYNATSNMGAAGATIDPFQAFWVHVTPEGSTGSLTLQPPSTFGGTSKPIPFDANWWLLQLSATSGALRDDYNWVGVHAEADTQWDIRDGTKPGKFTSSFVHLYIDHPDWGGYSNQYHQDVRETPYNVGDTVTWTATLEVSSTPMTVDLFWPTLDVLPSEWTYTFDGVDMATTPSVSVLMTTLTKTFTVTATRLQSGVGTLAVALGPTSPAPSSFTSGDTLTALQLELSAAAEEIDVDALQVGTEGAAAAGAIRIYHDLNGDGVLDAGEPEITSMTIASGTSMRVLVVLESIAGSPGDTIRAILDPAAVTATGSITATAISGNGTFVEGATMLIPSAPAEASARVSGGGGSGSGCAVSATSTSVGSLPLLLIGLLALGFLKRRNQLRLHR